jgi:hypothetical protein
MQPRCSTCWTTQNLAKCSKEDCPNLVCTLHGNRYSGRCSGCWDTAHILLPPSLSSNRSRSRPGSVRHGARAHPTGA